MTTVQCAGGHEAVQPHRVAATALKPLAPLHDPASADAAPLTEGTRGRCVGPDDAARNNRVRGRAVPTVLRTVPSALVRCADDTSPSDAPVGRSVTSRSATLNRTHSPGLVRRFPGPV